MYERPKRTEKYNKMTNSNTDFKQMIRKKRDHRINSFVVAFALYNNR